MLALGEPLRVVLGDRQGWCSAEMTSPRIWQSRVGKAGRGEQRVLQEHKGGPSPREGAHQASPRRATQRPAGVHQTKGTPGKGTEGTKVCRGEKVLEIPGTCKGLLVTVLPKRDGVPQAQASPGDSDCPGSGLSSTLRSRGRWQVPRASGPWVSGSQNNAHHKGWAP